MALCLMSTDDVGGSPVFQSTTVNPPSGVTEDGIDAPADHGVADHHVERNLDVDRRAGGPRRQHEGLLQFREALGVGDTRLTVDRSREIVEVEQSLGVKEALHPVVKCRSLQGIRIGAGGQPPLQSRRCSLGIATDVHQRADGQLRR